MKKKLFVLLVILAVVLSGVFAEPAGKTESAEIQLKGTVGLIFQHGLFEDGELVSSKSFTTNVLGSSGTTFSYGYLSNQDLTGAKLTMSFTDFVTAGEEHSIQIGSILVAGGAPTFDDDDIVIFDSLTSNGGSSVTSKSIKIVAAQTVSGNDVRGDSITKAVTGAHEGDYTATLTFKVIAD